MDKTKYPMTSKQKKEMLEEILKESGMSIFYGELIKEVYDDLEASDILKNHLYYDEKKHCIKMKAISKSTHNFDYEILKEWMSDENKVL